MIKSFQTYFSFLLVICITLISCGGSSDSNNPPDDEPIAQVPGKSNAILPSSGEPCSDYEDVAGEEDKALVFFQWSSASGADSYEIVVLEGGNQVATASLSTRETEFVLDRGKTFTWTVTAINDDGRTTSDTFSFTSPGIPVSNFAPYAAEISIEFDTNTTEIDISWIGDDEDGDTLSYDINVFENGVLLLEEIDFSTASITPIMYLSGATYTIEVISRDSAGNFSISIVEVVAP